MALRTDEPVDHRQKVQNVQKRNYDEKAIKSFHQGFRKTYWVELKKYEDPNEACRHFFETFISVYSIFFPESISTDKNRKSSQPLNNQKNH